MATNEDGRGGAPLTGVTFLGLPAIPAADGGFRVKFSDGRVEGPLSNDEIRSRIERGELDGGEGVSRDGTFWIPMSAVPMFRDALNAVATGESTHFGVGLSGMEPASQVPPSPPRNPLDLPGGFLSHPGLTEESGALPLPQAPHRTQQLGGGAPGGGPTLTQPASMSDLPGLFGGQSDLDAAELAASDLPGLRSELPGLGAELPRAAEGRQVPSLRDSQGLSAVQSAAGLPRSAGTMPLPGLPASASGGDLSGFPSLSASLPRPVGAPSLPQSSATAPALGGASVRSALADEDADPLDALFGGGTTQAELPRSTATTMMSPITASPDLPASTKAPNALMGAAMESLWDDDADVVPGVGAAPVAADWQAGAAPAGGLDFDADPFAGVVASSAGAPASGMDFFDEPEPPPVPAGPPVIPGAAAPIRQAPRQAGGGRPWLLWAGVAAAVTVAGGVSILVVLPMLQGRGGDEDAIPEMVLADTPVQPVQVTSAVVDGLDSLTEAGPEQLRLYIEGAGLHAGSAVEDRARVLVAMAALWSYVPEDRALLTRLTQVYTELETAGGEPTELTTLAVGAFGAVTGEFDATQRLSGLRGGEAGPWAGLMLALQDIQAYRGVQPEAQPVPAAAEPSAAEGSAVAPQGDAAGAGEAADGEAASSAAGEAPEAAAPAPARTRPVLAASVGTALDRVLQGDPTFASAVYWRAWVALEQGDEAEARRLLGRLVERMPSHVPAQVLLSRAELLAGLLGDADVRIQRVLDELESQSSPQERAQAWSVASEVATARMQPQLALEHLLSALQADPRNREALLRLAALFVESGQHQRALEYFQNNAGAQPGDPEPLLAMAQARMGLRQYDEAETLLQEGQQRFPQDGRFLFYLGRVAEERTEFDRAAELYLQASQIDPLFQRSLLRLGYLARQGGDVPASLGYLQQVELDTLTRPDWASELGELYLSLGETNRAVGAFRRALEINRTFPTARLMLAQHYMTIDQPDRALGEVTWMLESGVDNAQVHFLHGRVLVRLGRYSEAMETLTGLVNQDEANSDYLFWLGLSHFGAEDWTNARRRFTQAYENRPTMTDAMYYMGRCDLELGSINEAISALTSVSHRSARGEYHYWLGVALERGNQPVQAFQEYGASIGDDIGWSLENPEVFFRRAQIFFARGSNRAALRDLRVLLILRPNHGPGARALGMLHHDERRFAEAIRWLQHSLGLDSAQPDVEYLLGLSYLRLDPPQQSQALAYFEAARRAGYAARRPELHQRLAYLYRDMGRRSDAVASLRSYLENPNLGADERREMQNEIRLLGGTP
jgi:tetratricopeptide (TPR) repeat protein